MIQEPLPAQSEALVCVSCGAKMKGKFCHKCGEKRIVPEKDYNLFSFIQETVEHYIKFDTKVLRTIQQFFLQPGGLTAAWIEGRRKTYMKPLNLFLTVAVIVHFFLPNSNIYFDMVDEIRSGYASGNRLQNTFGFDAAGVVHTQMKKRGISEAQFYELAFKTCYENSKFYLFVIAPFWAFPIWLFFYRQYRYYLPHLIFAVHSFAFFMIFDLLFLKVMTVIFQAHSIGGWQYFPLFIGYGLYLCLAMRRVYGRMGIVPSVLRFAGMLFSVIVCIVLYRQLVTVFTLMWM